MHTLSAPEIQEILADAIPRLSTYYVEEFERVQSIEDTEPLRSAFAQALAANLRVIPLFGSTFGAAVMEHIPSDGAVGFADERVVRAPAPIAAVVVAAALAVAGAVGAHYVVSSRTQVAATEQMTPRPVPVRIAAPFRRNPQRPLQHSHPAAAVAIAHPVQAQEAAAPVPAYIPPHRPRISPPHRRAQTVPVANGVAVVTAQPKRSARRAVAQESSTLDTADMPEAYSDATPIPQETAVPITDVPETHVATPTPAPNRGWLHRAIMHLDPFKPHP